MNMMTPVSGEGGNVYLNSYLAPFAEWLTAGDVTEILVNRPQEIWVERIGAEEMERHVAPAIDAQLLERLAQQVARISHQGINRESPLLAATLPGGARIQIILPPATRGSVAIAIRKHVLHDLTVDGYLEQCRKLSLYGVEGKAASSQMSLSTLLQQGDVSGFLKAAVAARKTILLSGGTSSGKTTLLNALLKEIPASERVIAIEDTPEIKLGRDNAVGLVAVSGDQGEARVTIEELMRASLRMRPDRLIVGELRGAETVTFLRAINTGHPGSISTIHASTTQGAFEQLALMCMQADLGLGRNETIEYARSMIDIIIQLDRKNGQRSIADIQFKGD